MVFIQLLAILHGNCEKQEFLKDAKTLFLVSGCVRRSGISNANVSPLEHRFQNDFILQT